MLTLIIATLAIALIASGVTVYAFATAKAGFENEDGYHTLETRTAPASRPVRRSAPTLPPGTVPPFASAG